MLRPPAPRPAVDPYRLTAEVLKLRKAKQIPTAWIDAGHWTIGDTGIREADLARLLEQIPALYALARAGALTVEMDFLENGWIVNGARIATTPEALAAIVQSARKPATPATAATTTQQRIAAA